MSVAITDLQTLQEYIDNVLRKAGHHSKHVIDAVIALVGAVAWKADRLEARTHKGAMANMIKFRSKATGKEYCISYNHKTYKIELRDTKMTGDVLGVFDRTNINEIFPTFEGI